MPGWVDKDGNFTLIKANAVNIERPIEPVKEPEPKVKNKRGRPKGASAPMTNAERQAAHRAKKRALRAPQGS